MKIKQLIKMKKKRKLIIYQILMKVKKKKTKNILDNKESILSKKNAEENEMNYYKTKKI